MSDPVSPAQALAERITDYLGNGGFFNPEMMCHDKVRDLLMDCRSELQAKVERLPWESVEDQLNYFCPTCHQRLVKVAASRATPEPLTWDEDARANQIRFAVEQLAAMARGQKPHDGDIEKAIQSNLRRVERSLTAEISVERRAELYAASRVTPTPEGEQPLLELLADFDGWLANDEGLMIEDVIDWREKLARALGKPPRA